ncbi:penicillin-binding transpeptidase domain-containing protein [uncultured Cellulomonas sp.]|uniref:penicillin-binding transpeptidase domain-containing protein n=1 Tax=uncultured Cellulomonas sp. TaxID=189682 RepID=UPI002634D18A|nr:penicillin-binding transpeptidase domain-containing protein [uncultured Cellulomonas sp.]
MTSSRPRTAGARPVLTGLLLTTLTVGTLTACTPDRPDPDAAAEAFAQGLETLDLTGVPLEGATPAEATEQLTSAVEGLDPWRPQVDVASVDVDEEDDTAATAQLEVTWDVDAGDTDWTYTTPVPLAYVDPEDGEAQWRVRWAPSLIAPGMVTGEQLAVDRVPAARGTVLGAGGTVLVSDRPVLRLGVDKTRVDAAGQEAAARALAALTGLDPDDYVARVAAAGEKAFVEAIVVRETDPGDIDVTAARAVPGVIALPDTLPLAPTRRFARPLLGTVGEATAEIVEASQGAVVAGDLAGLSGLQQQYDARLRGLPGLTIHSTGAESGGTRDLFRSEPVPGEPLQTTLDPSLQDLAEATLADVGPASAIVAVRPSTGEVLAAASGPGSQGYSTATLGQYAPGSTFKVATSLGLLRAGLTPDSAVSCPATITADGRTFENYPGYPAAALGDITLLTAIANSCNTAMIGARDTVPQGALADAASSLGLGQSDDVGFPAFLGSVPADAQGTDHAASMIGQGRVQASPLAMAVVAASVAGGRPVTPVLVVTDEHPLGTDAAAATPLTAAEAESLRVLMRAVVTEGSGDFLADLPGEPVGAKSGTAQFGTDDPPRNHAWMIATQGDLAVAVFVEEGDFGSTTAGPLLKAFLRGAAA